MPTSQISTHIVAYLLSLVSLAATGYAQFQDDFNKPTIEDWEFFTGDGDAILDFKPHNGFARMEIDATHDAHNVWWSLIKRDVSTFLDMEKLALPEYELRVEARVRVSDAPRRLNFMINTQRTVDYHEHLREYDIPDTDNWHTISFTTKNLDAIPGDNLYVQLCATDLGHDTYHVDLDYYKASVVRREAAADELGEPLVYHPPIAPISSFENHIPVAEDATLNTSYPNINFSNLQVSGSPVLTVAADQFSILRWDFSKFKNQKATGPAILELTSHSFSAGGNYIDVYGEDLGVEFGKVRIFEIFAGDPDWQQESVTFDSFTEGKPLAEIQNSQMIFDTEISEENGGKTFVTISRPVFQRLLDGTTKGLLLKPLGAINANIYDSQFGNGALAPTLHFSVK